MSAENLAPTGIFLKGSYLYRDLFLYSLVLGTWCFVLILLLFLYLQHTNIHGFGGIRTRNPSKAATTGLSLRPCCHWVQRDSIPRQSIQYRVAIATELTRTAINTKTLQTYCIKIIRF